MTKEKVEKFVSPKGEAKFPWIKNPDYGNEQFPIPQGQFKTSLLVKADECKELCEMLDGLTEKAFQDALNKAKPAVKKKVTKHAPYSPALDADGEEIPDLIEFRFKMNHKVTSKKTGESMTLRPDVFDAKGKKVSPVPAIYGGTIMRVGFIVTPFFNAATAVAGVSLRMNAVQIIELVSGNGGTAASHGFSEEDGFDSSEGEEFAADASSTDEDF